MKAINSVFEMEKNRHFAKKKKNQNQCILYIYKFQS